MRTTDRSVASLLSKRPLRQLDAHSVNYDVSRRYLAWMLDKGLVELQDGVDGHERVTLTMKGEETYGRLIRWTDDFIHMRD